MPGAGRTEVRSAEGRCRRLRRGFLLQEPGGEGNTLFTGQGIEFAAERGAGTYGKRGAKRGGGLGSALTGGVERSALAAGGATAAEDLEVVYRGDVSAGHSLVGVKDSLGAVEPFGRASEDGGGVGFHRGGGCVAALWHRSSTSSVCCRRPGSRRGPWAATATSTDSGSS